MTESGFRKLLAGKAANKMMPNKKDDIDQLGF